MRYIESEKNELLGQIIEFMLEKKFEWHRNVEIIKNEARIDDVSLEKLEKEGIGKVMRR